MKNRAIAALTLTLAISACQVTTREPATPEPKPEPDPTAPALPSPDPSGDPSARPSESEMLDRLKGQKICTEMGCIDGFHVDVEPQAWAKGQYKLVIEADGKKSTCEATLPLPACGKQAVSCKGDVQVMIGESGCALPPDQQGLGPFNFKGAPAKVSITVSRGGKEVGKGTFSPTYKQVQPNGPSCPPTCNHASDKITIK